MRGRWIAQITPDARGRWHWPLKDMEVGDYFKVARSLRDPRSVFRSVEYRGARVVRSFEVSVVGEDTKVQCVGVGLRSTFKEEEQ